MAPVAACRQPCRPRSVLSFRLVSLLAELCATDRERDHAVSPRSASIPGARDWNFQVAIMDRSQQISRRHDGPGPARSGTAPVGGEADAPLARNLDVQEPRELAALLRGISRAGSGT